MKKSFTVKSLFIAAAAMMMSWSANAQTLFSEDFAGFTAGSTGGGAASTDLSTSLDTYTAVSGWTGSKVYSAGKTIKMGTSTVLGWIQTPAINLPDQFTISFKAMAWSGDATNLKIYLNGDSVALVSGLPNTASYVMQDFTVSLTGGTTGSTIKFEGQQDSKGRFFLDDLVITAGQAAAQPTITLASVADIFFNETHLSRTVGFTVADLTDDVTVSADNAAFTVTPATLDKADGAKEVTVSFTGTASTTATLTIASGTVSKTIELNAVISVDGNNGTKENPYNVADVVANQGVSTSEYYWVEGYIVGVVGKQDSISLEAPFNTATNILIAASPTETDTAKCMPVQLPSGTVRTALNLVDNPANLGVFVKLEGTLEAYYLVPAVKNVRDYELVLTSLPTATAKNISVATRDGSIIISGAAEKAHITVYDLSGRLLKKTVSTVIPLTDKGVYIVKVDGKAFKVLNK